MSFDDGFDDGESQPCAGGLFGDIAGPIEFVENVGLILRRDAGTFIRDFEDDLVVFGVEFNRDAFSFGGVFDGVPDEVIEHLAQTYRVASQRRKVGGDAELDIEIFLFGLLHEVIERISQHAVESNDFPARVESGFDSSQVEEVVDEFGDVFHAFADSLDEFALFVVERSNSFKEFRVSQNGGEGRA